MEYLDDPSIQQAIRNNMTETYNFTQLFEWEHKYLHWVDIGEIENRTLDPREILKSEKGHCGEFSLVYLTACLSLGYQARWMVSVRPFNYSGLHNWVEVMYNGSWVHVDPTEKIWDNPSMYSDRDWWGVIGRDALVFAFEKGKFKDVTSKYM
ncbi:MAG: transglutaminase-like domain-containing protein [archaeon]